MNPDPSMTMFPLVAQLPTPAPSPSPSPLPMSGEWASPESWSHLFQTAGVPAAILVFILALFAVFAFLALWWTVGPNGLVRDIGDRAWKRLDEFLLHIEANATENQTTLKSQLALCNQTHAPGGPCNVTDLRDAGHEFAEIAREIGKKTGAHVDDRADNIHKTLRTPAR